MALLPTDDRCDEWSHTAFDHDPACCTICHYPRTDGACGNPACGETLAAVDRFHAARAQRAAEAVERAQRAAMWSLSFTGRADAS